MQHPYAFPVRSFNLKHLFILLALGISSAVVHAQIGQSNGSRFCEHALAEVRSLESWNKQNAKYYRDKSDAIKSSEDAILNYLEMLQGAHNVMSSLHQSFFRDAYNSVSPDKDEEYLSQFDRYSPEEKAKLLEHISKWQALPRATCDQYRVRYDDYTERIEEARRTLDEIREYRDEGERNAIIGFSGVVASKAAITILEKEYLFAYMLFAEMEDIARGGLPRTAGKIMEHTYRTAFWGNDSPYGISNGDLLGTFIDAADISASILRVPYVDKILNNSFIYGEIVTFFESQSHLDVIYNSAAESIMGNIRHMAEQRERAGAMYFKCSMDPEFLDKLKKRLQMTDNIDYRSTIENAWMSQNMLFNALDDYYLHLKHYCYNPAEDNPESVRALLDETKKRIREEQAGMEALLSPLLAHPLDESQYCNTIFLQRYVDGLSGYLDALLAIELPGTEDPGEALADKEEPGDGSGMDEEDRALLELKAELAKEDGSTEGSPMDHQEQLANDEDFYGDTEFLVDGQRVPEEELAGEEDFAFGANVSAEADLFEADEDFLTEEDLLEGEDLSSISGGDDLFFAEDLEEDLLSDFDIETYDFEAENTEADLDDFTGKYGLDNQRLHNEMDMITNSSQQGGSNAYPAGLHPTERSMYANASASNNPSGQAERRVSYDDQLCSSIANEMNTVWAQYNRNLGSGNFDMEIINRMERVGTRYAEAVEAGKLSPDCMERIESIIENNVDQMENVVNRMTHDAQNQYNSTMRDMQRSYNFSGSSSRNSSNSNRPYGSHKAPVIPFKPLDLGRPSSGSSNSNGVPVTPE